MKKMYTLPQEDILCRDGQTRAFLRPYTKNWNNPESDSLHLEYSYNGRNWYSLNGNNGIWFPDYGSKQLSEPSIYSLKNGSYLITARDAKDSSHMYFAETKDFLSFTGAGYTGIDWDFKNEKEISLYPDLENRLEIPVSLLETLFPVYGKPEPVLLTKTESLSLKAEPGKIPSLPEKISVEYSNGGTEELPVEWEAIPEGLLQTPGRYTVEGKLHQTLFEKPLIYHRADPYIYKHTDGKYYFTASYTDMEHNLDGKYQYLYIILRRADTLEGLADGSDSYEEKVIYERKPINNGTMSPHIWAQKTNNISDIFIAQLSNPWTLCTPAVRLTHPEYNWELHGFPVYEGPGVIKHDGRIFITFSASGTDAMYCVGLLYADEDADLLSSSSWTKLPYPVFQSSRETGQYGLGHNSFTKSDDDSQDLIIYHGRQEEQYLVEEDYQPLYDAGRNASVGKIYWDKNGMPDFSVPAMGIVCSEDRLKVKAEIIVE